MRLTIGSQLCFSDIVSLIGKMHAEIKREDVHDEKIYRDVFIASDWIFQ